MFSAQTSVVKHSTKCEVEFKMTSKDLAHESNHEENLEEMTPFDLEFDSKYRSIRNVSCTHLSACYANLVVICGMVLPVAIYVSDKIADGVYLGFCIYLHLVSVLFIMFICFTHKSTTVHAPPSGSFYLKLAAIVFGGGALVYSGLEIGEYIQADQYVSVIQPLLRIIFFIGQLRFIFMDSTVVDMERHKIISVFGIMHMIATNLCVWTYVLVEETKHDLRHQLEHEPASNHSNQQHHGDMLENTSPFLYPCIIEYSLICAVILFEMWKKLTECEIAKAKLKRISSGQMIKQHQFTIDCSQAHRGMFSGLSLMVLTFIILIFYSSSKSLQDEDTGKKILYLTIYEIVTYMLTGVAVILVSQRMQHLEYKKESVGHHAETVYLDCTLLVISQTGVYMFALFSIMGSFYLIQTNTVEGVASLVSESMSVLQTTIQTLFILNASWRRCKGADDLKEKPGKGSVTFLIIANMAMWFILTVVKVKAEFRPLHSEVFGMFSWSIITHVSIPLAIFYRFHSTICLFGIWRHAYKKDTHENIHLQP